VNSDYLEKQFNAYIVNNGPELISIQTSKFRYKLSFENMQQENETTHTIRKIRRRPYKNAEYDDR